MLATSLLVLAVAATGLAQGAVPAGYKKVYITSNVNPKFVIVPKSAKAGQTLVVQTRNDKPEQQWYIKDGKINADLPDPLKLVFGFGRRYALTANLDVLA